MSKLSYSDKVNVIQAMPLRKGLINLTTGAHSADIVYCAEDGNFTITWKDAGTDIISMVEGGVFTLPAECLSITINLGKFHLA